MGVLFSRRELIVYVTLLLYSACLIQCVNSEPTRDKQALLAFISQIPHANRLQWNESDSACNWVGVKCDPTQSYVYNLRLPAVGLVGPIPPNTLSNLTQLRVLSLHANKLTGPLPSDISNLKILKSLYLHNNNLSGNFPPSISDLTRLTHLDLSTNNFNGNIPLSLNNLTRLTKLLLQNNNFSGPIPDISPPGLTEFNVSNNHLNGTVPPSLKKFPLSSFSGNVDLCGGPLESCQYTPSSPTPPPPQNDKNKSHKLSKGAIIAIAVAAVVILILLVVCLLICLMKRRQENQPPTQPNNAPAGAESSAAEGGTSSSKDDVVVRGGGGRRNNNNLVFLNGGISDAFDLEDMLRASAEVLGKGSIGTSYKAVLEEGTALVVKRIMKEVVMSEDEFEMQMQVLGRMHNHDNVVPLRAFYFSRDEKLLVSDYMLAGSLSALLHGNKGSGRPPLDWDSRIRIATTAAKGIAHLHLTGNLVHGNIKSSNILLRVQDDLLVAAVSDYGLNPLFDDSATPSHRIAGYRAPEVVDNRRVTYKSDVFSFGVLLLELLTGKAPNQATLGDEAIDLPRWVQSVVSEEWTAEVFDAELLRYDNIEEDEMVRLLQVAMTCVAMVPDQRPPMQEVVRMMEDLNTTEIDVG